MSENDTTSPKLSITWAGHAPRTLSTRIEEFKKRNVRFEMDARTEAIHFLRGTAARASVVLPSLYLAIGAGSRLSNADRSHWEAVQAAALEQSSLQTITLACRSIFDSSRTRLSGKKIARLSDETLASVAEYWAGRPQTAREDPTEALYLLRGLFARCAQPESSLIEKPSLLERRIGLLKYYAHRQAAHISLEDYLFDVLDLIHVAAAIALIGAIILEFDDPRRAAENYFDSIDESGWLSAKKMFPDLPINRLFKGWNIQEQARLNWKLPQQDGVEYILNQLPFAIGYWESTGRTE